MNDTNDIGACTVKFGMKDVNRPDINVYEMRKILGWFSNVPNFAKSIYKNINFLLLVS